MKTKHKDNVPQGRIRGADIKMRENATRIAAEFRDEDAEELRKAGELLKPAREAARNKVG